jgi:iron complex outermembrane receptor protein
VDKKHRQGFLVLTAAIFGCLQNLYGQENVSPILQSADTSILIDEVTVSAYRTSGKLHTTPSSISVLTTNDLRVYGGLSLANALSSVPGVSMQTGTLITSRLVIRGMGSRTPYNTNRIRAYLNDIPLTSADGISTPEEIDISAISRIEIIKGPASAIYGSGLGGSINMFTPMITGSELNVQSLYGSFNTVKLNITGAAKTGKTALLGSIGHLNSAGYRENNYYSRTTFLGTTKTERAGWSLNSTVLIMGVKGGIPSSLGKTQFEDHPEQAAPSWKSIRGYEQYFKAMTAVTLTNYLTESLTSKMVLFGKLNDNFEKRPFNNLDDITLSGGVRYLLTYKKGKAELLAGSEWMPELYRWKLEKDSLLLNSNFELRKQLSIFSMLNYKLSGKVNLSLATALNMVNYKLYDRFPADGDQSGMRSFPLIFSPRLGINYSASEYFSAYVSAGHGFSMPSPEETLLPEGKVNPDLRPEHGFQYEAGIRLNTKGINTHFDLAIYLIRLNDLLVTKRITEDIFTGINAGRTRHQGMELSATSELISMDQFPGKLKAAVSYTLSGNRFIKFTDNGIVYDGRFLPGIPSQSFELHTVWEPWKISALTARFRYTGYHYLNDENSAEYPGYFLLDLKGTARIATKTGAEIHISAGLENLTGTHYASMIIVNAISVNDSEPRYYYPGLPRNFNIGLQLIF